MNSTAKSYRCYSKTTTYITSKSRRTILERKEWLKDRAGPSGRLCTDRVEILTSGLPNFTEHLWAERITIRPTVGYSPYYLVNGHEPLLPCDAFVLTFAYTAKPMSHEELLASRIQLLDHKRVNEAIPYQNVAQSRFKAAHRWNLERLRTMLEEDHQPGTLVITRNSPIETSHSRKHQGSDGSTKAYSRRQLHPSGIERRNISTEIRGYSGEAVSHPRRIDISSTSPWQALRQRAPETPQEPESQDEASVDNDESEQDVTHEAIGVAILCILCLKGWIMTPLNSTPHRFATITPLRNGSRLGYRRPSMGAKHAYR